DQCGGGADEPPSGSESRRDRGQGREAPERVRHWKDWCTRPSRTLNMVVTMVMVVTAMTVMMAVPVGIVMSVIMIMMMNTLDRAAAARVFAEQQRFDRHRHGERRHPDASEIDVIEIAQHQSVDRQDLALDQQLFAQDGAQRLRDVVVEHNVERLPAFDGGGEAVADALGEGQNALVGRRTLPAQRERHLALAFDEIEGGEMRADRLGELVRIDALLAD